MAAGKIDNKIIQENLAANFCGLLATKGIKDTTIEWRILGQEEDGSLLASWISISMSNENNNIQKTHIGLYNAQNKTFDILLTLPNRENIIQASVNQSKTLLIYVIKTVSFNKDEFTYRPLIVEIKSEQQGSPKPYELLQMERSKQVMVQFLWRKPTTFEKYYQDKFLLFIHEENILLFTATLKKKLSLDDDPHNTNSTKINFKLYDTWYLDIDCLSNDIIVRTFKWAQWDPTIQALYYIHMKETSRNLFEKDDKEKTLNPTLSAYQFHDDSPTETVLNIPMNLPKIPQSNYIPIYEDDIVPLRIHDSTLNLMIISDTNGMLFVCHYYLYQPTKPTQLQEDEDEHDDCNAQYRGSPRKRNYRIEKGEIAEEKQITPINITNVYFAYSITILHHGCVIHCVIPGISWDRAKLLKPTFKLHGDHHMLVFQPDLFAHLLDVGISHEPCCHIICGPFNKQSLTYLVPCLKWGTLCYDIATLDLISINMPKSHLIETFRNDQSIDNRLSIIHYFLVHSSSSSVNDNMNVLTELLGIIMQNPLSGDTVPLMKEVLVAGAYEMTCKSIGQDAISLRRLLPLTTCNTLKPLQVKLLNLTVGISHEQLYNTTMMLLSPQQRLSPYRIDIWTKLWEHLNDNKERIRFRLEQVTEKLLLSLECYHPEALSKCTTPLSPSTNQYIPQNFGDFSSYSRRTQNDVLPFLEFEMCTASKQELVNSVNQRELSLHLVKHTAKQNLGFRWLKDSNVSQAPAYVHVTASNYVSAQTELSRILCVFACRVSGFDSNRDTLRGFHLIDAMTCFQQYSLYNILERYLLACETIAFPLPHGFPSFFTYLGYRSLSFDMFMQYVQRYVFELQIDVVRAIFADIEDSSEGISRKKELLARLPRSRAKRLLHTWNHPYSLMIRGREHAYNILAGNPVHPRRSSLSNCTISGNGNSKFYTHKKCDNDDAVAGPSDFSIQPFQTISSVSKFNKYSNRQLNDSFSTLSEFSSTTSLLSSTNSTIKQSPVINLNDNNENNYRHSCGTILAICCLLLMLLVVVAILILSILKIHLFIV